jgi:hypothetical protein
MPYIRSKLDVKEIGVLTRTSAVIFRIYQATEDARPLRGSLTPSTTQSRSQYKCSVTSVDCPQDYVSVGHVIRV